MSAPVELISLIREKTSTNASPTVAVLVEELLSRHGDSAQAILFYGSCFRTGDDSEGIIDLYVLVDSYRRAYRSKAYALFNKLLPPNVFYCEASREGRIIRAKYAVFSLKDFEKGASTRWFQSYLWSRLAQPMGLVYARDNHIAEQVYAAMARAVLTFITRVVPMMSPQFTTRDLWCKGLTLSYGAELRPERRDGVANLFDAAPDYYEELTQAAVKKLPYPVIAVEGAYETYYKSNVRAFMRISSRTAWHMRRFLGKALSILRLLKGSYTFQGGVEYVLWKIQRHSGITVHIDHRLRRVPVVGAAVLLWRLYRSGAFR